MVEIHRYLTPSIPLELVAAQLRQFAKVLQVLRCPQLIQPPHEKSGPPGTMPPDQKFFLIALLPELSCFKYYNHLLTTCQQLINPLG